MKHFFKEKIYKLWFFLYKILKIQDFEYRGLTDGEVEIAKKVFNDLINYNEVKIFNIPYLPWQPKDILMAPNGRLFVSQQVFAKDYSKCSIVMQGVFIHELTHVLQYQKNTNVVVKGFILQSAYYLSFKMYDPYKYKLINGKRFEQYNIEQQGDIARDIFFEKIPNIIIRS
ncbi:TPA: hypothetical protein JI037_16380 [Acinetobacter baumannii]|uniref:hypothetical protein n=1 Tax=Acinetobacter TaxID=469 RepID=UPI001A916D25|nr:hypothetical protein [Acinetobacter baumannii]MBO0650461.1 hypothetical protein [Acinetobacter baumannii]MCG5956683.1 hypothetical protein [Acinetobacter baumannii]HAV5325552.1 hypothetical protein [Acinetobacter baumannii]HAV5340360.1 hypothetical protein [Acinetobacter baumannii]HAV5344009.1 hypothetical protein [Acinetobacter baumannii]